MISVGVRELPVSVAWYTVFFLAQPISCPSWRARLHSHRRMALNHIELPYIAEEATRIPGGHLRDLCFWHIATKKAPLSTPVGPLQQPESSPSGMLRAQAGSVKAPSRFARRPPHRLSKNLALL